jgi:phospholipid transport system substrate-binding protein
MASTRYWSNLFASLRSGLVAGFVAIAMSGMVAAVAAQHPVDPHAPPNELVRVVGNNALNAVRGDAAAKRGDEKRIDELISQYLLPYVDFRKTTRLAAGRHWRQATASQQDALVEAFKGTLIRTYGGALANVDKISGLQILPFRGDVQANDVVVRSMFLQRNGPSVSVDYRLGKSEDGWKIYDVSVEGIWLIQSYRNQFSEQIAQNGIDGLIAALNRQSK